MEERKYAATPPGAGRFREIPVYDAKAFYGRAVDESDPFERERYLKWEREYREWYEKYYKSYSAQQNAQLRGRGPGAAKPYSPERFAPPRPRDNSPYSRGRRDEYPPHAQGHGAPHPRARPQTYPEKYGHPSPNSAPGTRGGNKEPLKNIKEREAAPSSDSKTHKKHRKKRKDNDGYSHSDSMDESRKEERAKGDPVLMNSSRDDATPVRDEPMESAGVPYRNSSDKDKKGKSKTESKVKRKVDSTTTKKDTTSKSAKPSKDKDPPPVRDRNTPNEPPIKRIREEPAHKPDDSKHSPDSKLLLPRKSVPSRSLKSKDEPKVKKEPIKDSVKTERPHKPKSEKPFRTEEKPAPSKPADTKPEKRKRKEEKPPAKDAPQVPPSKSPRAEPPEIPKPVSEKPPERERPAIPALMDLRPEPVRKIKLNREIGKRISTERLSSEEGASTNTKTRHEHKTKLKVRRRVHATDQSGSLLVDYTR